MLLVLCVGVLADVGRRFTMGAEPVGAVMVAMTVVAALVNVGCLRVLRRVRNEDVSLRAAWTFSINDLVSNLGLLLAGILVVWLGRSWPDLVIAVVIALVAAKGGVEILSDARRTRRSTTAAKDHHDGAAGGVSLQSGGSRLRRSRLTTRAVTPDNALAEDDVTYPSAASRAFALVVALISGLSSSFGMVICKQPDGNSELELVPARQSTCVSCDGDDHAPETRRDREPGMSRATPHESCPCSDEVISGGLSGDRLLRNTAAEKVAEVLENALPFGDNEPSFSIRPNSSRKCRFVPPRPDPLLALLRATVRLI